MFGLVPFTMNKDLNNSNTMFNDLFGDFFNDNLNMNTAIKADIRETKEAYILEADLPGMRKEDINLEYNQNYLTIHAHKNETKEDKKENCPASPQRLSHRLPRWNSLRSHRT